jgi:hypothetical protein
MKQLNNNNSQSGYIALASVLVITVVVLVISTSVSLLSINDLQTSLGSKQSRETLDLVEGCTEEALLYLNLNNSLPDTVTLPGITCDVTLNSQTGIDWTFTVSLTNRTYTRSVQVTANRSNTIEVTSWQVI